MNLNGRPLSGGRGFLLLLLSTSAWMTVGAANSKRIRGRNLHISVPLIPDNIFDPFPEVVAKIKDKSKMPHDHKAFKCKSLKEKKYPKEKELYGYPTLSPSSEPSVTPSVLCTEAPTSFGFSGGVVPSGKGVPSAFSTKSPGDIPPPLLTPEPEASPTFTPQGGLPFPTDQAPTASVPSSSFAPEPSSTPVLSPSSQGGSPSEPTEFPVSSPVASPTAPNQAPNASQLTQSPTTAPVVFATWAPTVQPTTASVIFPTLVPTALSTSAPVIELTFEPTALSTTSAPVIEPTFEPTANNSASEPSPPIGSNVTVDCAAIAAGNATTAADSLPYNVDLELVLANSTDFDSLAPSLLSVLQTIVAPRVAGCTDAISGRRLESATIVNVLFADPEVDEADSCTTDVQGASCVATNVPVDIYYVGNDTDDFADRLLSAIQEAIAAGLFDFEGLLNITAIAAVPVGDDAPGVSAVESGTDGQNNDLAPGGIVAISVAAVGLLLVLMLLVRRRSRTEVTSKDDGSLLRADTVASSEGVARVVGDDLSWYSKNGYILDDLNGAQHDSILGRHHAGMDVHACKSAMCKVCENRRQQDTVFIKTGVPPVLKIPQNATREYTTNDTVDF